MYLALHIVWFSVCLKVVVNQTRKGANKIDEIVYNSDGYKWLIISLIISVINCYLKSAHFYCTHNIILATLTMT